MRLGREILSWRPDGLVPVPLHPAREKKRGYNQAGLLAEEMGKCLNFQGWWKEAGIPVPRRNWTAQRAKLI